MNLGSTLSKLAKNHTVLFTVVAAVALMYVLNNYSLGRGLGGLQGMASGKQSTKDLMYGEPVDVGKFNALNPPEPGGALGAATGTCGQGVNYRPSAGMGRNSTNAPITGMSTNTHGLPPSCTQQAVVDPRQLLPRDTNNSFSKMNPMGAGDIQNVSLLKAGYHIGINTVGQSLRNANLQLRSEPANPQLNVGPWNKSTIGPDFNRRALEIGCHSSQ